MINLKGRKESNERNKSGVSYQEKLYLFFVHKVPVAIGHLHYVALSTFMCKRRVFELKRWILKHMEMKGESMSFFLC